MPEVLRFQIAYEGHIANLDNVSDDVLLARVKRAFPHVPGPGIVIKDQSVAVVPIREGDSDYPEERPRRRKR